MPLNAYDSHFSPQTFLNKIRLDAILRNIPNKKCKILDVGCRYGIMLEYLGRHGHDCYGIDPDPDALRLAKEKNLNVKEGYAERIPYPDKSFDVVIFSEVIEHLRNPMLAICEISRVLKKGGLIIITTPNLTSCWLLIERFWDWYAKVDYHNEHLFYFSPSTLSLLVKRGGFSVKDNKTVNFVSFLLSPISLKLSNFAERLERILLSKVKVGLHIILVGSKN